MICNLLVLFKIFGVSFGVFFFIVFVMIIILLLEYYVLYLGVIGVFIGGLIVYIFLGVMKGMIFIKLVLVGMVIYLFFSSMIEGIIILNENLNE